MLELLRALNWTIRADVPWPTKRGQSFDFVLVGEPGVFALWVHDGEPEGVEEAAVGLSALLDGVRVRPVICRGFASLGHAHPEVLYCTPETALDLLIGLPAHEDPAAIRAIATRLRDLEVPPPPEPEPPVVVEASKAAAPRPLTVPAPRPPAPMAAEPPRPHPAKVEPSVVTVEPSVVTVESSVVTVESKRPPKPAAVVKAPAPPVVTKSAPQVASTPKPEPMPLPEATPPPVKAPEQRPVPVVEALAPAPEPRPELTRPLPAGRHRSERPRFVRRTPPPPPTASAKPKVSKSTLELPTALTQAPGRARGGNEAAERFDNGYVYVPEPSQGPGPLKREFRAKPFLTGIVVLIALVVVAGLGVKAWPKIAGLIKSDSNPSATFGQTITTSTTNFHPDLALRATLPQRVARTQGTSSYSVGFSVSNVGTSSWALPPRTAFVLVDSLGESHAPTGISGVASTRWAGSLKPKQSWSGRLVFDINSGRTPSRVRFALASNGSETATWKQP